MKTNSIIHILSNNKAQWPKLLLQVLISLLRSIMLPIFSLLLKNGIDLSLHHQFEKAVFYFILATLLQPMTSLLLMLECFVTGIAMESIILQIRTRFFSKLGSGQVSYIEKEMRTGDIASRLNSDLEGLSDEFGGNMSWLLKILFQSVASAIGCLIVCWQLSLIYFFLIPITIWGMGKVSVSIKKRQTAASAGKGEAMNHAVDMLSNLNVIKSFHAYDEMNDRYGKAVDKVCEENIKSQQTTSIINALRLFVSVVQTAVLFMFSLSFIRRGFITAGGVIAFISMSEFVREGFSLVDYFILAMRRTESYAKRLNDLELIPMEINGSCHEKLDEKEILSLSDLSFSYDESREVLHNIRLKIAKGQKVALVGESGSGKSTIINLICRFYAHQSGDLNIFGVSSEEWELTDLRKKLSLVPQEPFLFNGTIAENISYGKIGATEEEIIKTAKDAGLWPFISSLEKGIYTDVGEAGGKLSGGQRQRICIARAMIKDAPLILLDEPTSSLDVQMEAAIQIVLDQLLVDKSAIIVAHRLSTIQNVDYIYCFAGGKIIEEGRPKHLLMNKGYYYSMCVKQGVAI